MRLPLLYLFSKLMTPCRTSPANSKNQERVFLLMYLKVTWEDNAIQVPIAQKPKLQDKKKKVYFDVIVAQVGRNK